MMQLRYDEDLVESAVFSCASRKQFNIPLLQIARFQREREKLYVILDPDERNAAFFNLHLEWFREWNLEKVLTDVLVEYPLLPDALKILVFRKARARNEEGAELYVNSETGRTAVVALRAERFGRESELSVFLRHEFMHLRDMVEEAFGYSPELHLPGQNAVRQRLTRERYRLLWDITIDGRLARASHATGSSREQHRAGFDRAFGFLPESRRAEIFASLWDRDQPRHSDLLDMAADPRDLSEEHGPLPGALCPLCGFPTFQWAASEKIGTAVTVAVNVEFPHWRPHQGICQRCHEMYAASIRFGAAASSPVTQTA